MEYTENKSILSFDMLYTNNHIQILKILLPCFESQMQKKLTVMIKYLELQYTIEYFRKHPLSQSVQTGFQGDIIEIFDQIRCFCTPSERAVFDQLSSLKQNMDRYDEMMNMMQMFSGITGMDSQKPEESLNPMELLKNMLTPEQQSMFDMFTTAFPAAENQV
ncbi:MAG: hypothetical protein IKC46_00450 [Lachnospiraceae bacterium]|nr:hypothetical protein [Lachnospiraceae bacterium]